MWLTKYSQFINNRKEAAATKRPVEYKRRTLADLHLRDSSEEMVPGKPSQFNGSAPYKVTISNASATVKNPLPKGKLP